MLRQAGVVASVVLMGFAGQMALAGPVLDIDPDLMGLPRGGVVVDQQPDLGGGPAADTDFVTDTGLPFWQLLADNVRLSESVVVRRITWWGFYGGDFDETPGAHDPPDGDETMRIRLYSARVGDGLPDTSDILFQRSFVNPSRTATGRTLLLPGIPAEYRFEVDLGTPLSLDSSVLYWLEIVQDGDPSSVFRWQQGIGAIPGRVFSNPIVPEWQQITGSLAFQFNLIPEPESFGLVLSCVVAYVIMRPGGRRARPR